jgi:hypothetical protein
MTDWHGYFGIEDMALTAPQRTAIVAALRTLGPDSDPQPAHIRQFLPSLDGSQAIFEALFQAGNLTVEKVKAYLANAVGANPENVDHEVTQTQYGPMVTYSAAGTDRLRVIMFGGIGATWDESRRACANFKCDHINDWEGSA